MNVSVANPTYWLPSWWERVEESSRPAAVVEPLGDRRVLRELEAQGAWLASAPGTFVDLEEKR